MLHQYVVFYVGLPA